MPAQPSNNMPEVMLPISQRGEITAEVDPKSLQETLATPWGGSWSASSLSAPGRPSR